MDDIAPELLEKIRKDFLEILGDGEAALRTYPEAQDYAERVGGALAEAFRRNLSSAALPEGRLYWNIADRVVRPMLEQDHELVSAAAMQVQQALNEAAGLGLKAQEAPLDAGRVDGILNKLAAAGQYDDAAWVLDEPVKTFSRAVVDETLRRNVEFQGGAGLRPKVVRRAESGACPWCANLAGTYTYPDVPQDVYRRHTSCRCVVEYDPGDGRRQNVHTKRWTEPGEILERRKNVLGVDTQPRIREAVSQSSGPENVMPEYLRAATPGVGSITYDDGYDRERHAAEIKTAQWLHDNLGGDIVLLQEINRDKQKTPDYLWRGRLWDLKTISSAKAANSAVRHGLKQIENNPGGIILDFGNNKFSLTQLWEIVNKRMGWYATQGKYDILVLAKGVMIAVKRY